MNKLPFETKFQGPEQSPGYLLWQVNQTWHRNISKALKPLDLTHPQFVLLAGCAWLTDPNQKELAHFCNVDINVVSQVIRALEKRSLVTREYLRDERSKCVRVTPTGKRLIRKAMPIVERVDQDFFDTLAGQQKGFTDCLFRLYRSYK